MRKDSWVQRLITIGICTFVMFFLVTPTFAQNSEGGIFQMVGNITIQKDQVIDGDVNTLAGNITVHGTVYGDVTSVAGNITIYGKVDGDVHTTGGNIYLKKNAEVSGDVTVVGGKVYKDPDASLTGSITQMVETDESVLEIRDQHIQLPPNIEISPYVPWYLLIWGAVTGLVSWLALGAFLMLFFAKQVSRLAEKVDQRPGYYFLIGLVGYLLFPPLLVLMVITIVGIPLALILILMVILGTLFGQLAVARSLGERVIQRFSWKYDTEMSRVLIGLVMIFLVTLIPVIGWVFFFATACIGFGTVLMNRFGIEKKGSQPLASSKEDEDEEKTEDKIENMFEIEEIIDEVIDGGKGDLDDDESDA